MSRFTSYRERRLWLWTLTVLVAIYSTLGPARTVVDTLREHNVALGAAFAYLVMFVRMGSPEERTHLIEYGIVAALIHQAFLGVLDEAIQAMLPHPRLRRSRHWIQRPCRFYGRGGEAGAGAGPGRLRRHYRSRAGVAVTPGECRGRLMVRYDPVAADYVKVRAHAVAELDT